jgi:hypothetical protein
LAIGGVLSSDDKLADLITTVASSSLGSDLPLESADQTQASSCISANDDKPIGQTTTITNSSPSHAPPFEFADQPQSRLMTVPRELRDMIYGYVFDYNNDAQKTTVWSNADETDHENKHSYFQPELNSKKPIRHPKMLYSPAANSARR